MKQIGIKQNDYISPYSIEDDIIMYGRYIVPTVVSFMHNQDAIDLIGVADGYLGSLVVDYPELITRSQICSIVEHICDKANDKDSETIRKAFNWEDIDKLVKDTAAGYDEGSRLLMSNRFVVRSHPQNTKLYCLNDIYNFFQGLTLPFIPKCLSILRNLLTFSWDKSPTSFLKEEEGLLYKGDYYADRLTCLECIYYISMFINTETENMFKEVDH